MMTCVNSGVVNPTSCSTNDASITSRQIVLCLSNSGMNQRKPNFCVSRAHKSSSGALACASCATSSTTGSKRCANSAVGTVSPVVLWARKYSTRPASALTTNTGLAAGVAAWVSAAAVSVGGLSAPGWASRNNATSGKVSSYGLRPVASQCPTLKPSADAASVNVTSECGGG